LYAFIKKKKDNLYVWKMTPSKTKLCWLRDDLPSRFIPSRAYSNSNLKCIFFHWLQK